MRKKGWIATLGLLVAGCTLDSVTPGVRVQIRGASPSHRASGRSGPELVDMKCYGVVVEGEAGEVSSYQIADRDPVCLGLNGAFHGPFTYAELVAGQKISLPNGSYRVSVVGFHNIASCGGGLAALYSGGTPASTYPIGSSQTFTLPETQRVAVNASSYVPSTAPDRTLTCPPQGSCAGYDACDLFPDADGVDFTSRVTSTGQTWGVLSNPSPFIIGHGATASSYDNTGVVRSVNYLDLGTTEQLISASLSLGKSADVMKVGLLGRYVNTSNMVLAEVIRDDTLFSCTLYLNEVVGGIPSLKNKTIMVYPDDCVYGEILTGLGYYPATLQIQSDTVIFSYRGYSTQYSNIHALLTGASVGFTASASGQFFIDQRVKSFRAKTP